jgi:hypothetical protein
MQTWGDRGLGWEEWGQQVESARAGFAALINAGPEDGPSASMSQLVSSVVSSCRRTRPAPAHASSPASSPASYGWLGARAYGWRATSWRRTRRAPLDPLDVIAGGRRGHGDVPSPCRIRRVPAPARRGDRPGPRAARRCSSTRTVARPIPIDVQSEADFWRAAPPSTYWARRESTSCTCAPGCAKPEPTVTGWFAARTARLRSRDARLPPAAARSICLPVLAAAIAETATPRSPTPGPPVSGRRSRDWSRRHRARRRTGFSVMGRRCRRPRSHGRVRRRTIADGGAERRAPGARRRGPARPTGCAFICTGSRPRGDGSAVRELAGS